MPYGTIKVDNITFDNGGTDKLLTVSGLFFSTSGALTVTGTISAGNVTAPTATYTTLTGTTTAGTTATFTSGSFTSLTGVTTTVTSGIFGLGSAAAPSIAISGDPNTGIYSPGADQVAISTNGTGRLFIDSAGLVGINQASAGSALDVNGEIRIYPSSGAGNLRFGSGGVEKGKVAVDASSNYTVETAGSERLRIDSSGRLLVGIIASPANQLQVATDSAGKPSTNTWTIVSDERIKEEIELADLSLCYQAVKGIPLKRYKWKEAVYTEEQVHDRHKLGWISQDVKAVFPKAVRISEFKYNQVFDDETGELVSEDIIEDCHDLNADQLYAAMYGAVQMLMAKVETLEASNTDLLTRVTALEAA